MDNIQLSVNCPKCGATNKFDQDNIPTFCSFCGSALPSMAPHVDEAIKISLERQRHQMRIEELRKETKARRTPDGTVLVKAIVCTLVFLVTMIFAYIAITHKNT